MKIPFKWSPTQQQALEDLITSSFKSLGSSIFAESQRRVPVVTGALKASGSIAFDTNGFSIEYDAPYARSVESGGRYSKGAVDDQPWTQEVPSHWRKTKKGRVRVKAHTKNYATGKPVKMEDGTWRTFTIKSVSRGKHFLSGSIRSYLNGALQHQNGLEPYLERNVI